jgi:hypothetical protein
MVGGGGGGGCCSLALALSGINGYLLTFKLVPFCLF